MREPKSGEIRYWFWRVLIQQQNVSYVVLAARAHTATEGIVHGVRGALYWVHKVPPRWHLYFYVDEWARFARMILLLICDVTISYRTIALSYPFILLCIGVVSYHTLSYPVLSPMHRYRIVSYLILPAMYRYRIVLYPIAPLVISDGPVSYRIIPHRIPFSLQCTGIVLCHIGSYHIVCIVLCLAVCFHGN